MSDMDESSTRYDVMVTINRASEIVSNPAEFALAAERAFIKQERQRHERAYG